MLVQTEENAGPHVVRYDGKNRAAGVYYASLKTDEGSSVKKVVYVK
jgi:hypothetical protein